MESQKAWDRQPKETDKSFSAFSVYLKTGSLRAAYRKLPGKSHATAAPGGWRSWSVKNSWVSRRAAWLDNETRVTQDAALAAKVEVSRTLTECKLELTKRILAILTAENLTAIDLLRAARALALHWPPIQSVEDISEPEIESLSDLSDEQLERMEAVRDAARLENAKNKASSTTNAKLERRIQ